MDETNLDELRRLRVAAEGGNAAAQASLGLVYELGHGVARDTLYASYLYRQAALAGDVGAQYALALLYASDLEVTRMPALALHWFALAAQRGHAAARRRLLAPLE